MICLQQLRRNGKHNEETEQLESKHVCGKFEWQNCENKLVEPGHCCFMRCHEDHPKPNRKFFCADFESDISEKEHRVIGALAVDG